MGRIKAKTGIRIYRIGNQDQNQVQEKAKGRAKTQFSGSKRQIVPYHP